MITRPSLRDFKQDPELLYETKQLEKEVNKEIKYFSYIWAACLIFYILGVYIFEISRTLAWLIGFPTFIIFGVLGAIFVQVHQQTLFQTALNEYDNQHILHRV